MGLVVVGDLDSFTNDKNSSEINVDSMVKLFFWTLGMNFPASNL